MPIGKLLILPDVSSSANFRNRLIMEEAATNIDTDGEIEVRQVDAAEAEGDGALISSSVSSPDLKDTKLIPKLNETAEVGGSHPDGDHAIGIAEKNSQSQLQQENDQANANQSHLQLEIQKWIKVNIAENHGELLSTDGDALIPVFLSRKTLHKSYSSSETNIPHHNIHNGDDLRGSANRLSVNSGITTSSTTSSQTENDVESSNFNVERRKEESTLRDILKDMKQKNFKLKQEIEEKNQLLQKHELSIHALSTHRLAADTTSIQDICAIMKDYAKRIQESPSGESHAALLTTTPESNQLVIGGLAGYLGAYALKNFGKTLCAALSGGTFLVCLGYQHGFLSINWEKIYTDLGMNPMSGGTPSVISAVEFVKRTQSLSTEFPYAVGGFLTGFCTGILS